MAPPQSSNLPPFDIGGNPFFNFSFKIKESTLADKQLNKEPELPLKFNEFLFLKKNKFNIFMNEKNFCENLKVELLDKINSLENNLKSNLNTNSENSLENNLQKNSEKNLENIKINILKNYLLQKENDINFLEFYTNHLLLRTPEKELRLQNSYFLDFDTKEQPKIKIGENFSKFENSDNKENEVYSLYGKYYNCMIGTFTKLIVTNTVYNCRYELAKYRVHPKMATRSLIKKEYFWNKYEKCLQNSIKKYTLNKEELNLNFEEKNKLTTKN